MRLASGQGPDSNGASSPPPRPSPSPTGVAGRWPIPAVLNDLLLVADDAVLVQEASIITGMRMLLIHAGLVVEPSAALGIAAIFEDPDWYAGRHVATIVCHSNVDMDAYHRRVGSTPNRHKTASG
jgi:threonine dehydratase